MAAWTGPAFELLLFSYLAAVGVALAAVDIVEHRLPGIIVLSSYVVVGAMLAAHATITGNADDIVRAVVGCGALGTCYLALALATRGGLGAGDVKLAGLLGLASGWISWPAVLWSTFLAWALTGVAWLVLALTRPSRPTTIPMGPFLILGTLCSAGLPQS